MNNTIYVLNEEGVAIVVECEIDVENLEGCTIHETLDELEHAYKDGGFDSIDFEETLININENEIVSNSIEGTIEVIDNTDVAVYVSAFSL
tara:strand:+ start:160 stop:432 length:273 start_codon:yes stop_codon:yes gene_type:complete